MGDADASASGAAARPLPAAQAVGSRGATRVEDVREEVLTMTNGDERLMGVLALPAALCDPEQAVLIIVGGPQYRVGSHRQFVQLSRALAAAGYPSLRFDVQGMGDSTGRALPDFEDLDDDINTALQALYQRLPSLKGVVLWGLCDGASAALLHAQRRPHRLVNGLCLVNPWVRSAASQAQTTVKHYYRDRLRQPAFWLKLLKGGVAFKAAGDLFDNLRQARGGSSSTRVAGTGMAERSVPFQQRMAKGWRSFPGPLLLLISENDYTAKEFLQVAASDAAWKGALVQPGVTRVELPGTDHTCSDTPGRRRLEAATVQWLQCHLPTKQAGTAPQA